MRKANVGSSSSGSPSKKDLIRHKTRTCEKTLDPEWNESFEFVGVRADSFEAVMRGSAASDLPAAETIAEAVGDVPTLALCWDCGDATHPESSARAFAAAAKGARVHVAKTLEEVEKWPGMINAFVDEIVGKRGAGGNE